MRILEEYLYNKQARYDESMYNVPEKKFEIGPNCQVTLTGSQSRQQPMTPMYPFTERLITRNCHVQCTNAILRSHMKSMRVRTGYRINDIWQFSIYVSILIVFEIWSVTIIVSKVKYILQISPGIKQVLQARSPTGC